MGVSGNSQWVVACWLADGDATAPLGYLVHPPSFFLRVIPRPWDAMASADVAADMPTCKRPEMYSGRQCRQCTRPAQFGGNKNGPTI